MPAEERQGKGIPWSLSPLRASSTLLSVLIKDVCGTGAGRGNACEARKGFPDDMLKLKSIHYSMYMEKTRREAAGVVQQRRNAPAEGRASKSIIADSCRRRSGGTANKPHYRIAAHPAQHSYASANQKYTGVSRISSVHGCQVCNGEQMLANMWSQLHRVDRVLG